MHTKKPDNTTIPDINITKPATDSFKDGKHKKKRMTLRVFTVGRR